MNLYVDDDSVAKRFVVLLRAAGHRVTMPADVGKSGAHDPVHLTTAVRLGCVLLTRDHEDFEEIHDLVQTCSGTHRGIFTVRFDDNPKHNMKPHQIVHAIAKFAAAGVPIDNQLIVLNQWR